MDSIPREIIHHHSNDNNDNENQARQVKDEEANNNNNNSVKEEEEEVDEDEQWKQMLENGRDYFPRINRDREDDPILLNDDDDDDISISSSSTSSSSSSSFSSSTEEGNSRSGVFDYYNNNYNDDENSKQSDDDRIPLLSDQDDQNRRKKGIGTNEIINSMKETLNTAVEDLDDWFIGRGRKGTNNNNNNNNNDSKSVMNNNNNNLKNHNLSSIRYNDPIETLKEETKQKQQQQQQHHFETFHPEEETQHEQYDDNEEKEIPSLKIKTSSVFLTTGRQNTQEKEITTEQLYKWNRHNTLHINSSSSSTTTTATNKKKKLEFLFFLLVAYAVVSYYNTASKTTTTIIGGYNKNNIENDNNNNLRGEQLEQAQQQQQETINTINSNSWFPTLKQQQSQQQVQQQQMAEFEYPQMEFLDREKEQLHDMTGMEDDMVVVIEHIRPNNNHDTDHPTQQTQMQQQQQEQDPSQANQQPLMTDASTPLSEMLLNIMGTKVPKQQQQQQQQGQGGTTTRVDGLLPIFWLVPPTSYISKSVFNIFDDCLDFTRSVLSYDSDQHIIEYVSTIPQSKEEEGEDIKEDIIIASNLMNLFQIINPSNPKHKHHQKGLAFTFLQHPVERAAQYFDYLKGAAQRHTNSNNNDEDVSFLLPTGEQIDPAIAKMNLLEYARYRTSASSSSSTVSAYENNFLVRSLAQVPMNVPLHGGFVSHAEQVLRSHFIVGLVDDEQIMMESFLRILKWIQAMNYGGGLNGDGDGGLNGKELLLAQHLNDPNLNECIHGLLPPLVKNKRVMEGSEEYHLLAQLNKYDMIFYQNVRHIFEEQGRHEIFSGASN